MEDLKKLIEEMEKLAAQELRSDDPDYLPGDLGNYDDARSEGMRDADIMNAQQMLPFLKELYALKSSSQT